MDNRVTYSYKEARKSNERKQSKVYDNYVHLQNKYHHAMAEMGEHNMASESKSKLTLVTKMLHSIPLF